ncbi:MAG: lytic murein transglycosylase [Syntrophobacteraceae bacterium]|nr:lytic murein transglycosylase [Syntrophobacteraceae bacterium]
MNTPSPRHVAFALVLSFGLTLVTLTESTRNSEAAEDSFRPLKERLLKDGFSRHQVENLYRGQPSLQLKTVSRTFQLRESQLDYDQFLDAPSIEKGKRFAATYRATLQDAEQKYGVDRCVIVAILLVETQFGSYTGKTPTLAVLSTFALMNQESYRDRVWTMLSPREKTRWGREAFDRKLMERAEWAYGEVLALVRLADDQVRVESLRGSVMGAVGWPQFLPSSLVRHGADGNGDGRVDLFDPSDACHSIARYLHGYGWCQARTREEKEQVVYQYNRSRPYVRTILEVADRLRSRDS